MTRWVIVAGLLGIALAVALFASPLRPQAAPGTALDPGAATPDVSPEARLAGGKPSGRSDAAPEERMSAMAGTQRFFLRVSIDGLPPTDPSPVSIHIEPGHMGCIRLVGEEADAEVPTHGAVEIDVTPVFERERYEWLSVRATHPRAVTRWMDVAVPSRAQPRNTPLRFDATVTLVPAVAIVGRVLDDAGSPREARIAAHAIVGRLPSPVASETVSTTEGSFRLRLPDVGPWVIVAESGDRPPLTVRVRGGLGRDTNLGDLVCTIGLDIRGRVVSDAPLTDVVAELTPSPHESRASIGPGLLWRGERAERSTVRAKIDKDGTYALRGLATSAYRVSVTGADVIPALSSDAAQVVSAPATGVDFNLRAAAVTVALRGRAQEAVWASVSAGAPQPWSRYWSEDAENDEWTLWVPPDVDGRLRAVSHDFSPHETEFRTPGPGERMVLDVKLERRDGRTGSLSIKLQDEHGATPASARFTFEPTDGSARFERDADPVDGNFRLDSVPVGDYEVDCSAVDGASSYSRDHVPSPARVRVDPDLETRTSIVCVRGGRAAMIARDTDGTRLTPRCEVRHPDGAAIADVAFVPPIEFWGSLGLLEERWGALHGIGEQEEMYPTLARGDYNAIFSLDDYQTATVPFRIVGGQTTTVAVSMHRR